MRKVSCWWMIKNTVEIELRMAVMTPFGVQKSYFWIVETMQTLEWIRGSLYDLMNMKKEDVFIIQQGVGFEIKELSLRKELIIESFIGIR